MGLIETLLALPALATPDFFNGCFEFGGALWLLKDVAALYRARKIEGVHWAPRCYFALWGAWNLFYYPALGQWWSFSGGLAIVCVNSFWVLQLLWYSFTEVLLTMPDQYDRPAWRRITDPLYTERFEPDRLYMPSRCPHGGKVGLCTKCEK